MLMSGRGGSIGASLLQLEGRRNLPVKIEKKPSNSVMFNLNLVMQHLTIFHILLHPHNCFV